jgi:hypothetical protein
VWIKPTESQSSSNPSGPFGFTALPQIVTDGEESGGVGYSDYKDAIVFYAIVLSWRTALQPRTLAADAHIREVTVARAA